MRNCVARRSAGAPTCQPPPRARLRACGRGRAGRGADRGDGLEGDVDALPQAPVQRPPLATTPPVSAITRLPASIKKRLPVSVMTRLPASVMTRLPVSVMTRLPVSISDDSVLTRPQHARLGDPGAIRPSLLRHGGTRFPPASESSQLPATPIDRAWMMDGPQMTGPCD